jgi:hypothetical protein
MSIIIDGNSGISSAGGTPIVNTNTNPSSLGTVTSITSIGNVSVTGTGYGHAFADGSLQTTVGYTGFRNRIINGGMVIDQRYSGAATANTISGYTVDRWAVTQNTNGKLVAQQNAASVTPPPGFTNYLGVTSQSAYVMTSSDSYTIYQWIEGYNINDLAYGTANARSIAVSFWVYTSLTGVYSWRLVGANNGGGYYSYVSTFTVSVANTWQFYSFIVPGSTAGQWFTNNGNGLAFQITLANNTSSLITSSLNQWISGNFQVANTQTGNIVGTNGATFYLTGVQLERGSTATPFEFRQFGTELSLCQRYCYRTTVAPPATYGYFNCTPVCDTATTAQGTIQFPVPMRSSSGMTLTTTGTAANYSLYAAGVVKSLTAIPVLGAVLATVDGCQLNFTSSGLTAGQATNLLGTTSAAPYLQINAEF